jgi:hypothetical protein
MVRRSYKRKASSRRYRQRTKTRRSRLNRSRRRLSRSKNLRSRPKNLRRSRSKKPKMVRTKRRSRRVLRGGMPAQAQPTQGGQDRPASSYQHMRLYVDHEGDKHRGIQMEATLTGDGLLMVFKPDNSCVKVNVRIRTRIVWSRSEDQTSHWTHGEGGGHWFKGKNFIAMVDGKEKKVYNNHCMIFREPGTEESFEKKLAILFPVPDPRPARLAQSLDVDNASAIAEACNQAIIGTTAESILKQKSDQIAHSDVVRMESRARAALTPERKVATQTVGGRHDDALKIIESSPLENVEEGDEEENEEESGSESEEEEHAPVSPAPAVSAFFMYNEDIAISDGGRCAASRRGKRAPMASARCADIMTGTNTYSAEFIPTIPSKNSGVMIGIADATSEMTDPFSGFSGVYSEDGHLHHRGETHEAIPLFKTGDKIRIDLDCRKGDMTVTMIPSTPPVVAEGAQQSPYNITFERIFSPGCPSGVQWCVSLGFMASVCADRLTSSATASPIWTGPIRTVPRVGAQFVVLEDATVRAGSSMDSYPVGILDAKAKFIVMGSATLGSGVVRIKFMRKARGWVSLRAVDGNPILQEVPSAKGETDMPMPIIGETFVALEDATVREESSMDSDDVTILPEGDRITVLEVATLGSGVVRIRFEGDVSAWVSLSTVVGKPIIEEVGTMVPAAGGGAAGGRAANAAQQSALVFSKYPVRRPPSAPSAGAMSALVLSKVPRRERPT